MSAHFKMNMVNLLKTAIKRDIETEEKMEELQETVRELERQNSHLKNKVLLIAINSLAGTVVKCWRGTTVEVLKTVCFLAGCSFKATDP